MWPIQVYCILLYVENSVSNLTQLLTTSHWIWWNHYWWPFRWMSHKFTPKREAGLIHFIENSSNLNCQLNIRFPFLSFTEICTSCKMHNCAWNLHCRSHHTDFESQLGSITLWCKHFTWHWHASHMWWISIPRHHVEGNCCHFSKPYRDQNGDAIQNKGKPCWKCHVMLHCYMSCQTFEKVKKGNSELDKLNFSKFMDHTPLSAISLSCRALPAGPARPRILAVNSTWILRPIR